MAAPYQFSALHVCLRPGCGYAKPLFIKPHTSVTAEEGSSAFDGKSLFVSGIPRHLDGSQLEEVFLLFGPIATVSTHVVPLSGPLDSVDDMLKCFHHPSELPPFRLCQLQELNAQPRHLCVLTACEVLTCNS